ncbi:MAG: hypothetical protein ACOYYF_16155 [Chloroflexota bacterium]|nr:hypothetical protein [Chloroflexota bacterium]MBI5704597.1 hypothetical protein [Chloroflexota bacterium]
MAKFKPLNENQLIMLPISIQSQLVSGNLEHTISEGGCGVEIACNGSQYRQNPRFREAEFVRSEPGAEEYNHVTAGEPLRLTTSF